MTLIKYILLFTVFIVTNGFASITIGTGNKDLYFYQVGLSLCKKIELTKKIACHVRSTKGSGENLLLLHNKKIDIALVQSDVLKLHQPKNSSFKVLKKITSLQLIILTTKNNIHSFSDLNKLRINYGPHNSGLRVTLVSISKLLNMDMKSIAIDKPASTQINDLCNHKLDAVGFILPFKSKLINKVGKKCPLYFVGFSQPEIKRILKSSVGYRKFIIPAHIYPHQNKQITTISLDLVAIR